MKTNYGPGSRKHYSPAKQEPVSRVEYPTTDILETWILKTDISSVHALLFTSEYITFGDFVKQGEYFLTSVPDHCKSSIFAGHYYSKLNIHPGILYSFFWVQ